MTNKEILTKAISKAVDNGFDDQGFLEMYNALTKLGKVVTRDELIPSLVFSHDFVKSFWGGPKCSTEKVERGSDMFCSECGTVYCASKSFWESFWQYHGQQLFLAEDRLKYIERYL